MAEERIIAEYGSPKVGEKVEVPQDASMQEGTVYEFFYNVVSLPIPVPGIDWFRTKIVGAFMRLQEIYRGLEIFYYRFTDEYFVFQAVGRSSSPLWKEIALSVLIVAASGVFLVAGVVLVIQWVKKVSPKPPFWFPPWWVLALAGIGTVGFVYLFGYMKGRTR